jgi:DNA primase
MAFPDGFIEEVRRSADIVAYVDEHVSLKKAGAAWKGRCPFHEEKTPSFNVRQEPPLFHCFGCGVGGDIFKFVMLREQASFPEAVEAIARRFGVTIPERSFAGSGARKERQEVIDLVEAATAHYEKTLWTAAGRKALEYSRSRNFEDATLREIRAGAAPDAWQDLIGALQSRYDAQRLVAAGLAIERKGGSGHYDRFRNRIVFPILNEAGQPIGFGARSLDGSEPKYLNSPETPAYHKSHVLYGLSWAREAARRSGRIVLMEGYLDVARALERGVRECVATCGTALTPNHARLLRRFTERVVLSFDQDEAGLRATQRSGELLLEAKLEVRIASLPEGHDPDSYLLEKGGDAYRERLDAAPHFIDWLAQRAAKEHDLSSPPGKAAYFKQLMPALRRVESDVERAAWVNVLAERAGLDPAAARRELRRLAGGGQRSAEPSQNPPAVRPRPSPRLLPMEKLLLTLILQRAQGIDEALEELTEIDYAGLGCEEILSAAKTLQGRGEPVTAEALSEQVNSDHARRLITENAVRPVPTERVTPLDCVREMKERTLEARITEIRGQIRQADAATQNELLRRQLELKQQLASLHRPAAAEPGP